MLVAAAVVLNACSNPSGRNPDPEHTAGAGPGGYPVVVAFGDVLEAVEPAFAADEQATDAPPAPRDWLKNLVGRGGNADPGAPSP